MQKSRHIAVISPVIGELVFHVKPVYLIFTFIYITSDRLQCLSECHQFFLVLSLKVTWTILQGHDTDGLSTGLHLEWHSIHNIPR